MRERKRAEVSWGGEGGIRGEILRTTLVYKIGGEEGGGEGEMVRGL